MEQFFPEILIGYLLVFRPAFHRPGWMYFQGFVWAMLLSGSRKCVTKIAALCFYSDRSLASWERFLAEQQWDMTLVVMKLLYLLKQEIGGMLLYAGRYIMALDTTYAIKVKGKMAGVQKWAEHSANPGRGEYVTGHHWAVGGLLSFTGDRWRCFPIWTRLISGRKNPSHFAVPPGGQAHPMSFWESVLALVFQASGMLTGYPLCVVADAYFAKACFFNPLTEKGITLITRLRHDAVGWDAPEYKGRGRPPKRGKKWKLADLWENGIRETVTAYLYGKTVGLTAVVRDVYLRDVSEKVRIVVIGGIGRPVLLACTDPGMSAKEIIEIYAARFSVEIAIRDLKGYFGLGDYQATTTLAFMRHVLLSCVSFCIGFLILRSGQAEIWLKDISAPVSETPLSFARLRRGIRHWVLRQFIFSKFAPTADLQKIPEEFEPLFRIAA